MTLFLGIDPGLKTIGFGVIEWREDKEEAIFKDCGIIKTPPSAPFPERLFMIKRDLEALLKEVQPAAVGVEKIFFAKNVTTALSVAHARGVILESLFAHHCPLLEFTPLEIKSNICGYGQAPKSQMQEMVRQTLKLQAIPKPDDAADALGIAICAARAFRQEIKIKD